MYFETAQIAINPFVPFFWALFVGIIFSTLGAAGGILAAVGHLSLMGISDANLAKPMNLFLVVISPLVAVPTYWRQGRVVVMLALFLGVGSIVGGILGSWFSKTYLGDISLYRFLLGFLILFISARLFYESTSRFQARRSRLLEISKEFQKAMRNGGGRLGALGAKLEAKGIRKFVISFVSQSFTFAPVQAVGVGAGIAFLGVAMGVGGGFLLVPYMASYLGMPMYVVAGTSALGVLIMSITGISSYVNMGVRLDLPLLVIEAAGVLIGSFIGPKVSGYLPERGLRLLLGALLALIGLGYSLRLL